MALDTEGLSRCMASYMYPSGTQRRPYHMRTHYKLQARLVVAGIEVATREEHLNLVAHPSYRTDRTRPHAASVAEICPSVDAVEAFV